MRGQSANDSGATGLKLLHTVWLGQLTGLQYSAALAPHSALAATRSTGFT